MTIRFRPRAREDVAGIVGRIAATRPKTAARFSARFQGSCELLERFLLLGSTPPWDDLAALGVRLHAVRRFRTFLIVYRPLGDGV